MSPIPMTWKSAATAAVSGAGVLATWIGVLSPPAPPVREQSSATQTASSSQPPDIERQAEHLQARLHADGDYRAPSRNPFRFVERPVSRRVLTPTPAAVPAPPSEPVRPSVRVSGIATDVVEGIAQRTAVLSTGAGLVIAKEGESSDGYTVSKIDDQGVDLIMPDGSTIRLPFANPESFGNPKPQVPNPESQE